MKRFRHAIASVALCGAAGCAYYPQEDGEKLANEVYALQTQVTALQQALAEQQSKDEEQIARIAQLNEELATLSKIARRNGADVTVQLDDMLETAARLKGRVEGFDQRLSEVEANTSKVQEELDLRFQGLAEKQKIDAAKSEEEKTRAIEVARQRERLLADPKAVFVEAERLTSVGQPAEARKLVRELQVRNKESKSFKKKHAANAEYLLGETYFAEGNFQQAAAIYNGIRKKHKRSKRLPNALFRLGMCFEKLGMKEDAKLFYETVRKKHKRSKVAKDAKARLKALGK